MSSKTTNQFGRTMLPMELAEQYSGYPARMLRAAVTRGELHAERPGGSPKSRLYFNTAELDRWMEEVSA